MEKKRLSIKKLKTKVLKTKKKQNIISQTGSSCDHFDDATLAAVAFAA